MDTQNNNMIWYVIGGVVLIVVGLAAYGYMMDTGPTVETEVTATPQDVRNALDNSADVTEDRTSEEIDAAEPERLADIAADRAALLAEQAALESQTATSGAAQVSAERQQEIDLQLLELQNQEEYPPLPNPGL